MEDDWDAEHAAEMELEREMYPEEDFNPKIKKKLKFDEENTIESIPSFNGSASIDILDEPVTPSRQKQSRPREDEASPQKPLLKRSRVAPIRHSAVPLMEDHISITGFNGRRVFVPLAEESVRGRSSTTTTSLSSYPTGQLLSTPIEFLLASLENQSRIDARRALTQSAQKNALRSSASASSTSKSSSQSDGLLWVDKYSPKSFQDLLSDEKTNREVLSWLKEWDKIVFGIATPPPTFIPASPYKKKFGDFKKNSNFNNNNNNNNNNNSNSNNSNNNNNYNNNYTSNSPFKGKSKRWDTKEEGSPKKDRFNRYGNNNKNNNTHTEEIKPVTTTNNNNNNNNSTSENKQNNNMPRYKAVLLCGPPGLGKTTLAHVLAKHAGYNPVEINASDDRKEEVFESKIYAAVGMQSVLGDKRPNCLIIDEIDGVDGRESNRAIDSLVKLITAERKKKKKSKKEESDDEDNEEEGRKKKKKKDKNVKRKAKADESDSESESDGEVKSVSKVSKGKKVKATSKRAISNMILQRPIICICNDMYVPSLRKLRNVAKIFNFTKPLHSRITSRLKQICQQEGVVADTQTLTSLVELANHDTRSCLHTLQFIKAKTSVLSPSLLASSSLGIKDRSKGLFEVWGEAAQRARVLHDIRRRALASSIDTSVAGSNKDKKEEKDGEKEADNRFNSLLDSVSSTGETEKVIEGCFENYLSIIHSDHMLEKSQDCLDWLMFADELQKNIRGGQHFELMKYEPLVPLAFSYKAASLTSPSIHFPKSEFENRMKKKQNQSIIRSFLLELPAELRVSMNEHNFALDYISPLLDILGPSIRPVNPQLLNEQEKATLNRLVEVMAYHKLTYLPDNAPSVNGTDVNGAPKVMMSSRWPTYKLEPAIDLVARFSDRNAAHPLVPHQLRHMLISQINSATLRAQYEELTGKASPSAPSPSPSPSTKPKPALSQPKPAPTTQKNTHLPMGKPKDFFGRPLSTPLSPSSSPSPSPPSSPSPSPSNNSNSSPPPSSSSSSPPSSPKIVMRYKFNEGFSNAVRRTVYVKDLL